MWGWGIACENRASERGRDARPNASQDARAASGAEGGATLAAGGAGGTAGSWPRARCIGLYLVEPIHIQDSSCVKHSHTRHKARTNTIPRQFTLITRHCRQHRMRSTVLASSPTRCLAILTSFTAAANRQPDGGRATAHWACNMHSAHTSLTSPRCSVIGAPFSSRCLLQAYRDQ